MVDQPDPVCLRGVDRFGGKEHFEGFCSPDEARETLCAPKARHEAESQFREPQSRIFRSDSQRTRHCQFESAAEAISVDRGDRGFPHALQLVQHPLMIL